MSYSSGAASLSRQPLNIVRLDLDTRISGGSYEYICDGATTPHDPPIYSCIESIEWIPQRTAIDGGLGYMGEVSIVCKDFTWFDGVGTFFGRLMANNPYFLNRKVKIYSGFFKHGDTFNFSNFQERDYFISDIQGPDQRGKLRIKALDIMSQTKQAIMPTKSNGSLTAALTAAFTGSTNVTDTTGFASSGYAIINDEVVAYTLIDGTNINITSRAQAGTTATTHAIGDSCRYIENFTQNVVDAIYSIIQTKTDIDQTIYVDGDEWTNEKNNFLSGENVETWVIEPTPVSDVIDELCKQTYINVFWDDVAQTIRLKAVGPTLSPVVMWDDKHNILDSKITIKRPQKNIYSQCWVYYDMIDKTGSSSDAKNFRKLYILADSDIETGLGSDVIKRIYCPYIPSTGSATASKVASRFIAQHSNPIDISFQVDTKDQESVEPGDSFEICTDLIQGTDGLPVTTQLRVIEKKPGKNNRWTYRAVFSGVEQGSRYPVIGPNSLLAYTSESTANQNKYGFICDTDNEMSNGDDPYLIL